MAKKQRWVLIAGTLILAGAAWLIAMWSTQSQATAMAPELSPHETANGEVTINWSHVFITNLSRSQERAFDRTQFPRIVAGPSRLYVMWEGVYATGTESHLTLSNDGVSWSEPVVISESLQTASEHTNFVQGADGTLHFVWHERITSSEYQLMYQRRSSAGAIVSTEELDTFPKLPVPVVAVHGPDDVHLAWLGIDPGPDYNVFHMRSDDGGDSWFELAPATTLPSSSRDVAMVTDQTNQVHMAWQEDLGAGTSGVIMYRVGTPTTGGGMTWGTVVTPSATLTNCVKPSVVVSGTEAYIGWGKQLEPQKMDVYFARCSGLACTTPAKLGPSVVVNTSDPSQSAPVLAMDENGTLAAVWHGDQEHSEPGPFTLEEILFTYSTDGGTTWAEVQNISQTPNERSIDPHLALVNGVAHVVWKERFDPGTPQKYDVWYANSAGGPVFLPLVLRNK